jgi:hypothetical protein
MAIHSLQHTDTATQHTLLIAGADDGQRAFLAEQLDADGHSVYDADQAAAVIAKLSSHAVDVLISASSSGPSRRRRWCGPSARASTRVCIPGWW